MGKKLWMLLLVLTLGGQQAMAVQWFDMWDWMIHDYWQTEHLDGTHNMSNRVSSPTSYNMITFYGCYEVKEVGYPTYNDICLKYESRGPRDMRIYNAGAFRWCYRHVYSGSIGNTGPFDECYVLNCQKACRLHGNGYNFRVVFRPQKWIGGNLGYLDVLELNVYICGGWDENNKEKYYYNKTFGMVRWENISGGRVTNSSTFNIKHWAPCQWEVCDCWPTWACNASQFPAICQPGQTGW